MCRSSRRSGCESCLPFASDVTSGSHGACFSLVTLLQDICHNTSRYDNSCYAACYIVCQCYDSLSLSVSHVCERGPVYCEDAAVWRSVHGKYWTVVEAKSAVKGKTSGKLVQLDRWFDFLQALIYIYIFIQSDLQTNSGSTFVLSVCVFPGNRTHNLCAANAMLYH